MYAELPVAWNAGQKPRLEERLCALESLSPESDLLATGNLILLLERLAGDGRLHLLLEVERDIALPLFDEARDFELGGRVEADFAILQQRREVLVEFAPAVVDVSDRVRE